MLWIGLRRGRRRDPLRLLVPASWLVVGLLFLVGFRIGLNVADSNVIDVGYAGVIGADRLADGDKLWGELPEGQRARRHLRARDLRGLRALRAGAALERALGRPARRPRRLGRLRPAVPGAAVPHRAAHARPTLGLALAYAWAANPFTLYALDCNVNDGLVAALVLAAIAAASSPAGRGAFIALAGMAKFAPLALAPLFATTRAARCASSSAARWRWRRACC